jgi:hypothetical protein
MPIPLGQMTKSQTAGTCRSKDLESTPVARPVIRDPADGPRDEQCAAEGTRGHDSNAEAARSTGFFRLQSES